MRSSPPFFVFSLSREAPAVTQENRTFPAQADLFKKKKKRNPETLCRRRPPPRQDDLKFAQAALANTHTHTPLHHSARGSKRSGKFCQGEEALSAAGGGARGGAREQVCGLGTFISHNPCCEPKKSLNVQEAVTATPKAMASMREYDHGHQQAAVFRSYPLALNGVRAPKGDIQPITTNGLNVITDHPPLEIVFTYLDGDKEAHHAQELHQNLDGCCSDREWAVVGVNKDRLNTTGGGGAYGVTSKNHKSVQVFGTTEVRLTKNSQAFSVGDEVYARFPTQNEVNAMVSRREPVSLIICRKTLAAPGSTSIAQLLQGSEKKGGTADPIDNDDDAEFEALKEAIENTIFRLEPGKPEHTVADVWDEVKSRYKEPQKLLKLIARLEKETSYARHRKIGRALKATRAGASKLLIFLDP